MIIYVSTSWFYENLKRMNMGFGSHVQSYTANHVENLKGESFKVLGRDLL